MIGKKLINAKVLIGAGMTASAAIGGAIGYLAAVRIQEKKFQERLSSEIQDAKAYYQQLYSTPLITREESAPEVESTKQVRTDSQELDGVPIDLVGAALDAVSDYRGDDDEEEGRRRKPETVNLFQSHTAPGEEVLDALLADRDPTTPYIITKEEYYENEPDHEQIAFTYWTGDGILVDDREEFNPIDGVDRVAGEDNLLHFGYGSEDENIVYIRNEAVKPPMDLCVTRSTGKYSIEVIGEGDEEHLAHSTDRRFRLHRDE